MLFACGIYWQTFAHSRNLCYCHTTPAASWHVLACSSFTYYNNPHCKALHERRQWRQWFLYFFGEFFPSYSSFHFLIQPSLNVTEPRCKTTSAIFSFSLQTTKRNIGWKKSVFVVVDKLFIQVQRAYTTGVPNQQNL